MEKAILVAEDTPLYGKLIVHLLSHQGGYRTYWAQTGQHALLLAKAITPLLFLLDYHLPDMTGIALYDLLAHEEKHARIPTLLLSADLPNQDLESQLTVRGIHRMSKPFNPEDFLLRIERLVKSVR